MKTLLVLRHAKSSWADASLADHDRPLKKRGRRDAPRMGELIRDEGLTPDLIVSSTAKRARQTAAPVAEACGYEGEVQFTRDLYHADPEEIVQVLRPLPDEAERVLIVGHNPGLEDLVEALTDGYERMPTAALAQIELPIERWADLREDTEGELIALWLPREL